MNKFREVNDKMEKIFDTNSNRRCRKKKEIDKETSAGLVALVKSEKIETIECVVDKEDITKIDLIDNISIYSFYDIETLKNYVKLNNLLRYDDVNHDSTNSSILNKPKAKRNESKFKKIWKENNENDLYENTYLKKLDDNLLNNEDVNSSLSNNENDSQDSSNDDTKSTMMIWQPTIKSAEIEKQKQIKKNLLNKKERNISITSSILSSRSAFSGYSHSESSRCSLSPAHSLPECGKAHCKLGCICDTISSSINDNSSCSPTPLKNNRNQNSYLNKNEESETSNHHQRDHCGRFECMFECNCSRRLRSSTRQTKSNKKNQQEEEEIVKPNRRQALKRESSSKTKQALSSDKSSSKENKNRNYLSGSSKSTLNHLRFSSKNNTSSIKQSIKADASSSKINNTQLRQSKRVKLLKKKSNLKLNQKNKDPPSVKTSNNFRDFYFYYDQDIKLNSLKSRNKNKQAPIKIKQEANSDNSETDVNFDDDYEDNANNNENYEDFNDNNKDDSDFILDKTKKNKRKTILNKKNDKLGTNSAATIFEPHTQNITLKIQSKSFFSSLQFVSIPLRIEVFTPKWNDLQLSNKKVLRLIAKLLQKLDVLNDSCYESKKSFKEIEFECDKEINIIVFAVSHLKDCSNIKDDISRKVKPICVKITDYNTQNKSLLSKSQLKSLISDERADQFNPIFNFVKKNEETNLDEHKFSKTNIHVPDKLDQGFSAKNIENIQKSFLLNRGLPRLLCRSRNKLFKRNLTKPNQTNLLFKNVDSLFEKLNDTIKPIDNYDKLSAQLFEYRPKLIENVTRQQNASNYIFADEIEYLNKQKENSIQYPFYNPFLDQSLILPMYKAHESRDFIDVVCNTVNDMIKVVSLYNENLNKKNIGTKNQLDDRVLNIKPNLINLDTKQKIFDATQKFTSFPTNKQDSISPIKINNYSISKIATGNENKTNYIIINPNSKTQQVNDNITKLSIVQSNKTNNEKDETKTTDNDLNIQRKIILPTTSMNFKTLVKIVSKSDDEPKTADNLNCKIISSNQKIKISSSLLPSSIAMPSVTTYSRSIFKTSSPNSLVLGTTPVTNSSLVTPTTKISQQQIAKILTPIAHSSTNTSAKIITSVSGLNPPKIITMPFKSTSNSTIVTPKIVSIPAPSSSLSNTKSFIPIRPKNELNPKQPTLNGLIMNKSSLNPNLDMKSLKSSNDSTVQAVKKDETDVQTEQYLESRKRKRKQDLSSLTVPIKSIFKFNNDAKVNENSLKTTDDFHDNIHLNILNKQISCFKNESPSQNFNLEENSKPLVSNKLKIGSNLNSPFKISTSLFKHHDKIKKEQEYSLFNRTNSIESLTDKDLIDLSSPLSNILHNSFSSQKASSDSNSSPSLQSSKNSTKILVYKEDDSEEEILESDNSDFSDNDNLTDKMKLTKKRRTKSKNFDEDSSDCSSNDDFEDNFEKKIAKKLLNSSNNPNKPIVNNIHSIRERQRRFRLKKLLIKLKIVLYECESNCKYDLENSESKLKLDEYFNQKNFKMKSKQNILQEAVLLIRGLQKEEKKLQALVGLEMKRNAELKFHLRELI